MLADPVISVIEGQELPNLDVFWYATRTTLRDFSIAHTFQLKIADVNDPDLVIVTKTAGFTGAAGSIENEVPNLVIEWSTTDDLNALVGGHRYIAQITATRTSDSRAAVKQFYIDVAPSL